MRNTLYILYLKTSDCDYEEGETLVGLFTKREEAAETMTNLVKAWSKDGWVKGWIEEVELGTVRSVGGRQCKP